MTSAISNLPKNIRCRSVWSFKPKDKDLTADGLTEAYVDEGVMLDSGEFSGTANIAGKEKIAAHAEAHGWGKNSDSLSPARLGCVASTLLGHADSDYLLRQVRRRAGA